jgi:mono/diheme cytochrome c family protein
MRIAVPLALAVLLAACAPARTAPSPASQAEGPQAALVPAGPVAGTPEARGQALAEVNCSTCHAVGPTGDSPYAPAPPFRTLNAKYDVEGLAEAFAEGIEVGHRGARQMPEFQLTPAQIDDLIAYLKSLPA